MYKHFYWKNLTFFLLLFLFSGCANNLGPNLGNSILSAGKTVGTVVLEAFTYKDIKSFRSPYGDKKGQIRQRIDQGLIPVSENGVFDFKGATNLVGESIPGMMKFYAMDSWTDNGRTVLLIYGELSNTQKAHWLIDMDESGYSINYIHNTFGQYRLRYIGNRTFKIIEDRSSNPMVMFYTDQGLSKAKFNSQWIAEEERSRIQKEEQTFVQIYKNTNVPNNITKAQKSSKQVKISKKENSASYVKKPAIQSKPTFKDDGGIKKFDEKVVYVKEAKIKWTIEKKGS